MNDRNKSGVVTANRPAAGNAQEFVRGVIAEMKRVTWPTREEWVSATVLAIALVVGVGLFTYVLDSAFGWLIGQLVTHR